MSNREDYLDSLLKSVTSPGEKLAKQSASVEQKRTEKPTVISPEDEFLMNFDQDLLDLDEDAFLREFEKELEGDQGLEIDLGLMSANEISAADETDDLDSLEVNTMDGDDLFGFGDELSGMDEIDAMLKAAMDGTDLADFIGQEETGFGASTGADYSDIEGAELDDGSAGLLDILAGMTEDSDLAEIGNMLKAHDGDEFLGDEEQLEMSDELTGESENEADSGTAEGSKKKAKKKEDKKSQGKETRGVMQKVSRLLFGEDEEEDIHIPEADDMDISDENMAILKDMEKARKKEQKREKKEQKKREREEKKAARPKKEKAPKPEKEKKPKEKSKPLPKGPAALILLMGASLVILIYLGSSLVGYSMNLSAAEQKYNQGDYVGAYQELDGMEIKEIDREFYDKARLTAYLQKGMDAYEAYMNREMYPEALDALITIVGRYDKYINEAANVGADGEYEGILTRTESILAESFSVALEEARNVYAQGNRQDYTAGLYELLERIGMSE